MWKQKGRKLNTLMEVSIYSVKRNGRWIHSVTAHWLPGSVLGTGGSKINHTGAVSELQELRAYQERWTLTKITQS